MFDVSWHDHPSGVVSMRISVQFVMLDDFSLIRRAFDRLPRIIWLALFSCYHRLFQLCCVSCVGERREHGYISAFIPRIQIIRKLPKTRNAAGTFLFIHLRLWGCIKYQSFVMVRNITIQASILAVISWCISEPPDSMYMIYKTHRDALIVAQ